MPSVDISVVIPAWNRRSTIGRTVNSIGTASDVAVELIIVDDGSTDGTGGVAMAAAREAGFGNARVLRQRNSGPGAARNAGAAEANGSHLAFLDSDDSWYPNTLEAIAAAVGRNPQSALFFLQTVDVETFSGRPPSENYPVTERTFPGFLEAVNSAKTIRFGSCNVVIRRDVFDALGGFAVSIRCAEDTDFFLRAARSGACTLLLGPPLVAYEIGGPDSLTKSFARVSAGVDHVLAANRSGMYPDAQGGEHLKDRMLAKVLVNGILTAFAAGRLPEAYQLMMSGARYLIRARDWHWLARLPLFPLIAALKPESFPMRWRPHEPE